MLKGIGFPLMIFVTVLFMFGTIFAIALFRGRPSN